MPDKSGRYAWVTRTAWVVLLVSLFVLTAGAVISVVGMAVSFQQPDALAVWTRHLLGAVITALLLVVLYGLVRVWVATQTQVEQTQDRLVQIENYLQGQQAQLRSLNSLATLSDQAKSLIYYEREVEALRESVNAMLLKQDYKTAEAVIERMASRLGLVDEAARLREHIENTRSTSKEEKIDAAIQRIHQICGQRDWPRAKREARRLMSLFPDHDKIQNLPQDIQRAWNAYKGKLLKEYSEAVRINDVDRSIELLQELDKYLTPQEGSALAESARDVFKKKLHNLGVQFAIAVADQQWSKAVSTGEEIIREFPNSRMSREVREKLDMLRDYASGARQPTASIIDQPDSPFAATIAENQAEAPKETG